MASLHARDQTFLDQRKARRSVGLIAFPVALAAVLGAWTCLYLFWPLAVNPFTVVGQIEQQTFEPGTLTMYAVSATVLMNVVLALVALGLTLGILWARHERRYQKLLEAPAAPLPSERKQP
jgi:hypothetical protein